MHVGIELQEAVEHKPGWLAGLRSDTVWRVLERYVSMDSRVVVE